MKILRDILLFNNEYDLVSRVGREFLMEATETEQLDGANSLDIVIKTTPENINLINKTNYVGIRHRFKVGVLNLYKITSREIDEEINIKCVSAFEYEAKGEEVVPQNWEKTDGKTVLEYLFAGRDWTLVDYTNQPTTYTVQKPVRYIRFKSTNNIGENIISEVAAHSKQGVNVLNEYVGHYIQPTTPLISGSVDNLFDNETKTFIKTANNDYLTFDLGYVHYTIETIKMCTSVIVESTNRIIQVSEDGQQWETLLNESEGRLENGFGVVARLGKETISIPVSPIPLIEQENYGVDYDEFYKTFKSVINDFKLEYFVEYHINEGFKVFFKEHREHTKPVARYVHGKTAHEITKEENVLDTYTAGIGLGKVVNNETNERLTFTNVVWDKSLGNPVNKPAGVNYLELVDTTKQSSKFNGKPRKKYFTYNDIEDSTELIKKTYEDLVEISKPKVQYRAKTIKLADNMIVGDPVTIVRHDLGFYYTTRVYKIVHNIINPDDSRAEFGNVLYSSVAKRLKNIEIPEPTPYDDGPIWDAIHDMQTGAPENVRPKPLDDKYFTFNRNETGWSITGLSVLGKQAVESGEITEMNLPEHRDGLPFNVIEGLGGFDFKGRIFVPYTYETVAGYGTFDGLVVDYIEFEDNGIHSGLKRLTGQYLFRSCSMRSGYLKVPPSLNEIFVSSFYPGGGTGISRTDVPQNVAEVLGGNVNRLPGYVNIYDPYMAIVEGNFLIEEEAKTITIVGLSYEGSMKNNVVVPNKIRGKKVRNLLSNAFRGYANPRIVDVSQTDFTALSPYVFAEMKNFQELLFPPTLTTIGEYAFYRTGIQRFTPVGVSLLTEVGRYAFSECTFEEFIMPDSFQTLGDSAFRNCKSLYNIQLSPNVIEISNNCFRDVSMLSEITFPPVLKSIGADAFQGTALTSVKFPESLTSIGAGAFMRLPLTSVEFGLVRPVSIGSQAFRYIPLTEVVLKSGSSWDTNRYRPTFEPSTIITLV